jgi:predicted ferric reductase
VFWIWASAPILGYIVERVLRRAQRRRDVSIVRLDALASRVTHVELTKPEGWEHQAGDYLFLRLPALAGHEWHPFTISSAPEQRETIGVHVRSLGNWTRALRTLAEARAECEEQPPPLRAQIDGPYGTPSAEIFNSSHAVLIGAGIGVTPFAAILQSILLRARAGHGASALRKVHFIWLSRDQRSFEWFAELLAELEAEDARELLDIQIYMTGARDDLKSSSLVLARELLYARTSADVVTGLRAKTNMGRPDWEPLLTSILRQHAPDPVDVYMCGPRGLVRVVDATCRRLGMNFRHEVF